MLAADAFSYGMPFSLITGRSTCFLFLFLSGPVTLKASDDQASSNLCGVSKRQSFAVEACCPGPKIRRAKPWAILP